jgi:hypothetical protein
MTIWKGSDLVRADGHKRHLVADNETQLRQRTRLAHFLGFGGELSARRHDDLPTLLRRLGQVCSSGERRRSRAAHAAMLLLSGQRSHPRSTRALIPESLTVRKWSFPR